MFKGLDLTVAESALLMVGILLAGFCCSYLFLRCFCCVEGRAETHPYVRHILSEERVRHAKPDSKLPDVPVHNPDYVPMKINGVAENDYPLLIQDQKLDLVYEELEQMIKPIPKLNCVTFEKQGTQLTELSGIESKDNNL